MAGLAATIRREALRQGYDEGCDSEEAWSADATSEAEEDHDDDFSGDDAASMRHETQAAAARSHKCMLLPGQSPCTYQISASRDLLEMD